MMALTIAHADGCLVVSEHPVPHWLFYGCFVAGGIVALYLSFTAASGDWQRAMGMLVGIGNIAGGLYMIAREPASRVVVDPATAHIKITRWGITGNHVANYALSELVGVDLETKQHTDGGAICRPRLRFTSSRDVPVSLSWHQKSGPAMAIANAIGAFTR